MGTIPLGTVAKLATKAVKKAVGPTLKSSDVQGKLAEIDKLFMKMKQTDGKLGEIFAKFTSLKSDRSDISRSARDIVRGMIK